MRNSLLLLLALFALQCTVEIHAEPVAACVAKFDQARWDGVNPPTSERGKKFAEYAGAGWTRAQGTTCTSFFTAFSRCGAKPKVPGLIPNTCWLTKASRAGNQYCKQKITAALTGKGIKEEDAVDEIEGAVTVESVLPKIKPGDSFLLTSAGATFEHIQFVMGIGAKTGDDQIFIVGHGGQACNGNECAVVGTELHVNLKTAEIRGSHMSAAVGKLTGCVLPDGRSLKPGAKCQAPRKLHTIIHTSVFVDWPAEGFGTFAGKTYPQGVQT